ncbi:MULTISPECIES: ABC transporter permease [Dehalobacter]|uniref:Cytolysin ABC transporter n=1 Tax=Dehalobacter restrictus (strain DSM 9455 / PER-K23) TaxID=871738 RepID=A0ABM5P8P3_DEHRP|nr:MULTISPECIES: ABC transporter permease [Dehalobacter]AHF11052.1 cytolysin ABC transporter precursor [Dehalobacter restrictus DSM 9455]MDJ0305195.1 ABC transporter permease [Dehalobacter sp.]OCZ53914.1 cytolysin ABC transporter precursor [Dehalobacter sp. TeCB1]
MRIIHIILKEFKQNIRDFKANIMMVLFPIVLIVILGTAFSGVFSNDIVLDDIRVLYSVQGDPALTESFHSFQDELQKQLGITFTETTDPEEGLSSIKNDQYSCFILLTSAPPEIRVYKNARFNFEANLVESSVKVFAARYDAVKLIAQINPSALAGIMASPEEDYVQSESIDKKREPGSLDYYAVTMLTLFLLYASLTGFWSVKNEQNFKTGNRILCSPVTKIELLTGKTLGGLLVTIVQAAVVLLFSSLFFKVYWGSDLLSVLLIIFSEAVLAISLGTGIAYLIRNDGTGAACLNVLIPIIAFLGGGYVPLSSLNGPLTAITALSPLKWTNEAIFRLIYDQDYTIMLPAILINLAVAATFLMVSAFLSRKEAV